jgi:NADH:ubiquinone reductase (H+-translocating)
VQLDDQRPRVVVVGAGFGGLAAVRRLAEQPVDVTVVDRNNFHTFLPLLYQVATSGLNAADVAHPIRAIVQRHPNVDVRHGSVVGVDWERKEVQVAEQPPIAFDHLVLAAGSTSNDFGIPGVGEHAYPLYTLADAARLRNRVLERFEAAAVTPSLIDDGAITFAIVGGGPTGVETAGAMAELFDQVLRDDFRTLPVERARVVLIEMADSLLTPFGRRSRQHALDALRRRGVEVRLSTAVAEVTPDCVVLEGGERIAAHTLVWAAGVKANPLADALGVETGPGGRIVVDRDLSVPERDGFWVIGDLAHTPGAVDGGDPAPQLAPAAMQAGELVAANIERRIAGRPTEPYRYRDKGTMATIGRRAAVAELPHAPALVGSLAWVVWLLLHLVMLIGFRNRLSVLVNWSWNYLTWDRGPRLIFGPDPRTPPGA